MPALSHTRRMGSQASATSHALLDATEHVLREEGYAAATSRRIAEVANTTQQLVYYYFKTIDEVLLAAYKRRIERGLERLMDDVTSGKPIHAIWSDYCDATDARLTFEYMALANRHAGIRAETSRFLNTARALQAETISKAYDEKGIPHFPVAPAAMAFLIQAVTLLLCRESDSGVTAGHDEIRATVEWALRKFE